MITVADESGFVIIAPSRDRRAQANVLQRSHAVSLHRRFDDVQPDRCTGFGSLEELAHYVGRMRRRDDIDTEHVRPPVPCRQYDWAATFKGYDEGDPIGRGPTEDAAIADLREQILDRSDDIEDDELRVEELREHAERDDEIRRPW